MSRQFSKGYDIVSVVPDHSGRAGFFAVTTYHPGWWGAPRVEEFLGVTVGGRIFGALMEWNNVRTGVELNGDMRKRLSVMAKWSAIPRRSSGAKS